MRKRIILICIAAILALLPACAGGPTRTSGNVKIAFTAPSEAELNIAPGRQFKVSGTFEGEVPDDAIVRVSLLDASGKEVRYAVAEQKGTDNVVQGSIGGEMTVWTEGTDFSDIAYTAPELVVADKDDPDASAHDATIKCVYTGETFYALITAATDTEHGLIEADGYELTDHEGKPYDALPEGKYTVKVSVTSKDGRELAEASEDIMIGLINGTVMHEMTSANAIEKGGLDLVSAWAAEGNMTVLGDLLPGMFGPEYQMSTMQLSVSCETAEYLPGKIDMLIYNNTENYISNSLELAKYLQLEHNVENPDIAKYFVLDLGEPMLGKKKARIIPLGEDEGMHICRVDQVTEDAQDGVFLVTEEQITESDIDSSDGWSAGSGAFAVAGVMKPYQLKDDEIVPEGTVYGLYKFLNRADTVIYTFTPDDGSASFSVTGKAGVSRIEKTGEEADTCYYEFYNVIPAGTLKEGVSYDAAVQAYDKNGAAIGSAVCSFTIGQ